MEELVNHEVVSRALAIFPKTQWTRLIRAFLVYGTEALQRNNKLEEMTVDDIEQIVYGPNPSHKRQSSLDLFMREIETIKNEITKLDRKIEGTLPRPPLAEQLPPTQQVRAATARSGSLCKLQQQQLTQPPANIYPTWWGPPDSNRHDATVMRKENTVGRGGFQPNEDRYKHELEISAVAAENARNNVRVAQRNPVKMVFEKTEFSGHQLYAKPNPVIIEKRREANTMPAGGMARQSRQNAPADAIPELRQEIRTHSRYPTGQNSLIVPPAPESEQEPVAEPPQPEDLAGPAGAGTYSTASYPEGQQPREIRSPETVSKVAPANPYYPSGEVQAEYIPGRAEEIREEPPQLDQRPDSVSGESIQLQQQQRQAEEAEGYRYSPSEQRESPYGPEGEEESVGASINMRASSNVPPPAGTRAEEVRQTVPRREGRNMYAIANSHTYTYARDENVPRPQPGEGR